ncbi:MAG TPA: hypothetical protein VLK85_29570 [Ramlibacter sp.]|nr:hypothetical protein [Ramlibacter sp.]
MKLLRRLCVLALVALLGMPAAAGVIGPDALRARHTALTPQLAANAYGRPLVLQSEEVGRRSEGDIYAVLDHPFDQVSTALRDPAQWCEVLILHLNTKHCRIADDAAGPRVDVWVGKKVEQAVQSATQLKFAWHARPARPDYFAIEMDAPEGPFATRDYRIFAEAVPLEGGQTFLHMGYAFGYGAAGSVAMNLYLGTIGRDKIGFTLELDPRNEQRVPIGGMRGLVERNTMRYYLAIDAYLASLKAPPDRQLEARLQAWFDATERYPRQLHEVERDAYLRMKRTEVQRQVAAQRQAEAR